MAKLNRRSFVKLGAAGIAFLAGIGRADKLFALDDEVKLGLGGKDYSPITQDKRKSIPSTCWQCPSRDALTCYTEGERLVKIEGNVESNRNRGKICSKGQSGVNQVYNPDRLLYPLKRIGKRGDGQYKRITWDEALNELTAALKKLKDAGTPEKFMLHHGRVDGSDEKIINNFLTGYGTGTVGNNRSTGESGKWTAQELTWGKYYDVNDTENTNMILYFGSNFFEDHTSHIQLAQRTVEAMSRGVKLYTFDVRLSNTAARSTEWIPVKPGTDGAIALAMCNVILDNNLQDDGFIKTWTNVTLEQLKKHMSQYTPKWAEQISGVPANKIKELAIAFAKAKPGTIVSYRGAVAHYNGVQNERAIKTLDAICGNIDVKGGTNHAVMPEWKFPEINGRVKQLDILDGFKGTAAFPTHNVNNQVLKMIKSGKAGRPAIYMTYLYNPAYVNGECAENIEILKDEKLIPYLVAVDFAMTETAVLADLILPDVTYLERWSLEDTMSYAMIPEFSLRQPIIKPLGEARQFQDVTIELSKRLGINLGYDSTLDFIKQSCAMTKVSFEYLKEHGIYADPSAKPLYKGYAKQANYGGETVIYDAGTGVYWDWKKSDAKTAEEAAASGYTDTKNAYKGYKGQKIGGLVYRGFAPDRVNKSGKFEIYSGLLKARNFEPMPSYMPIPEHKKMKDKELVLTTYKVNVQATPEIQNCKWLSEIYHDNPAWINPVTAGDLGIKTGQKIKIKSGVDEILTTAKVTNGVVPGIVAVSQYVGHWAYGEFASGKKSTVFVADVDSNTKWWKETGVHPNWVVPNSPDPIAGQQRSMDTVVTVTKA